MDAKAGIYSPTDQANAAVNYLSQNQKQRQRAVPIFIPEMRSYFADLMPGQVCTVLAQTSNGKTSFMEAWARYLDKRRGSQNDDGIVVYISVEDTVEESGVSTLAILSGISQLDMQAGRLGESEWAKIKTAVPAMMRSRLYRIAASLMDGDEYVELSLDVILEKVKYLQNTYHGKQVPVIAIFVDYLHAMPFSDKTIRAGGTEGKRHLQLREDFFNIRKAGTMFQCPVIVGAQAKQTLTDTKDNRMYLPGRYDVKESAAIAERTDRLISLWMPISKYQNGTLVDYGEMTYKVTPELIFIGVQKQRGKLPSGRIWKANHKYETGEIFAEASVEAQEYARSNWTDHVDKGEGPKEIPF